MKDIIGTYRGVRDRKACAFYCDIGMPKEMAEKLYNTHWSCTIAQKDGDCCFYLMSCQEMPELNTFGRMDFEKELNIQQKQGMGGDMLMKAFKVGENTVRLVGESSELGKFELYETYTPEGLELKWKHENGKTFEEFWPRDIDIDGFYVYEKGENLKEYAAKAGNSFYIDESYNYKIVSEGAKNFILTDYIMGQKNKIRMTLDEEKEVDYFEVKANCLLTKLGPTHLCFICRRKNGVVEEFNMYFTQDGMKIVAKHHNAGVTATLWLKRSTQFSGTFRALSHHGDDEAFELIAGIKMDTILKAVSEPDARLIFEEDGLKHRHRLTSKLMPLDVTFEVGKEFEFNPPFAPDVNVKVMVKKCGNALITHKIHNDMVMKDTITFSNHFMIKKTEIVGTDFLWTDIFERCDV